MKYEAKQAPYASTLMSCVKAAYEFYHKKELSDELLFGLTGHAFVINITNGIGPCAPYWWDMKRFNELCKSALGMDLFLNPKSVTSETEPAGKEEITNHIKEVLDTGNLVLMSSLEYQLIIGYENDKFVLTQPWGDVPSETKHIDFNTLNGMLEFMTVFTIKPLSFVEVQLDHYINSIEYAIELLENPPTIPDYAMGIKSYDYWLEKINEENYNAHGIWWSSTVWSESRKMAAKYMNTLKNKFNKDITEKLKTLYENSADLLLKLSNREIYSIDEKKNFIYELKKNEVSSKKLLQKLLL